MATIEDFPNPSNLVELQFTKTVHRMSQMLQRDATQVREQFDLDPTRRVVLVIDTMNGQLNGIDKRLAGETHSFLVPNMKALVQKGFSVLYAPHPLSLKKGVDNSLMAKLRSVGVHVVPDGAYPSRIPLWEVADCIIGSTSGVFHGASFLAEKPLILFRQSTHKLSTKCKQSKWCHHAY